MKTIIFSDVHLHVISDGKARMDTFLKFLRQIDGSDVEQIIVLGDLFDFWFEYREVIFSEYFDVLRAFADLRDQGVELHLACGNHDFWAGRFLEDHLGFEVHRDPVIIPLNGFRVLLAHGDGLNSGDYGYRIYKRFARAKPIIWLFSLLHPDFAMRIARIVSRGSRHFSSPDTDGEGGESKAIRSYAMKQLMAGDVDVVMCGHSHYPVIEEHDTPNGAGLYINSGDWIRNRSYVVWDGEEFSMEYFE